MGGWLIATAVFLFITFIVVMVGEPESFGGFIGCVLGSALLCYGATVLIGIPKDEEPEVDFAATAEQLVEAVDDEYGLEIGLGTSTTLLEGIDASILDRQGEVVTFGSVELLYAGEVTDVTLAWYSDAWVLLDDAGDPLTAAEAAEGWD